MARSSEVGSEVVPAPDDDSQSTARSGAQSSSPTAAIVGNRRETPGADRAPNAALARPARALRTTPTAAMLTGRKWRGAARWIGLGIFFIGSMLVAYVFLQALQGLSRFSQPDYLSMQMRRVQGDGFGEVVLSGVIVLGQEALRVVYLLLLGYLGSMIAGKGIQFFAASESVIDEAVVDGLDDDY